MPASGFDLYNMQDARNNFDAMRPTPICSDANQLMGQCPNIHISTNCYYGFHNPKRYVENTEMVTDCEMMEATRENAKSSPQTNVRKRSADDGDYRQSKRPREEVKKEKKNGPETNEIKKLDRSKEELLESLYWNIHGGNFIDLLQCL
ncbi:uncharacterized protein isoform X1 [Choristoneura fumiferana]|uniref:uncharacterized protein isoform X1 n=1 Tax=Choristoneura fumiferana TaxID=7141 RepID=UPI003D154EC3